MNQKQNNFLKYAKAAAKIADEKKGENISLLNVRKLSSFADYLLIITADSHPQINAISENIKKALRKDFDMEPIHREGKYSNSWVVIDYGGLVIHIMSSKSRQFYRLEKLWEKARHISIDKS